MKRYDMVTNYRCGQSVDELEPSTEGEWIRFEDVEAALAEVAALRDWKESAMLSFRDWHALGEALMEFAPLTIGDNIPRTLAVEIPKLLTTPSPQPPTPPPHDRD